MGEKVRAAVHTSEKTYRVHIPSIEAVPFDFDSDQSIRDSLRGIDRIFLLIPAGPRQNARLRRFIDIAREFRIRQVVKVSIIGADASPGIQFSRWHQLDEQYIEASGIPFTFLRPNAFMQDFITMAPPTAGIIYLPMGDGRVSYIDAHDIAHAAARAFAAPAAHIGKVYELTGPQSLSMDEVARILTDTAGVHIAYVDIPESTARHAMEVYGIADWRIEALLEMHRVNRAGLAAGVTAAVNTLLGRQPRTFEEFAAANAEAFRTLALQQRR
jgi:uncharacterized protein YbjT (DUF2867 family)